MKKALALVLALVLALSMGVVALADASLIVLEPAGSAPAEKTPVPVVTAPTIVVYEGGSYYVALEDVAYEDVTVSATGCVSAELVEFDPETMEVSGLSILYKVTKAGKDYATNLDSYTYAKGLAKDLNDAEKVTYYAVEVQSNVNIIKLTVEDNYSAAYKEGKVKISATLDGEPYSKTLTIINDVSIFEYEQVKYSAQNGKALVVGTTGYSDYDTAMNGYGENYNPAALRTYPNAAVVSTTAFRAIKGEDLVVAADENNYVTIKEVASSQKGVNFSFYGFDCYSASGALLSDNTKVGNTAKVAFGFYGNQVIASDFEINVNGGYTYYDLRELFGEKVEEEDIITYYILKDGAVLDSFTVDYMTVDYDDVVELVIEGKAGETLGQYELVLEVPAAPEGEENPNTGAESVIGVVAAMAVVSVAAAAAVSLKK